MYNPFPPIAGGAAGALAVTGVNSVGLAVAAIIVIVGGLLALRTARMKAAKAKASS